MHDISIFRNNLDAIAQRLQTRGFNLNVAEFRALDAQRRAAISESERLKANKNEESQAIGKLKKAGEDTTDRQQKVREIDDRMRSLDESVKELDDEFRALLA